jgi:hypothetical protein
LEPDGITLATVLAIELAIFATTPFLEPRLFAPAVFFDRVFVALLVLDFDLVAAAFFAITDSGTASSLQITLNSCSSWLPSLPNFSERRSSPAVQSRNHENSDQRRAPPADTCVCLVQENYETWRAEDQPRHLPRLQRSLVRQAPAPADAGPCHAGLSRRGLSVGGSLVRSSSALWLAAALA